MRRTPRGSRVAWTRTGLGLLVVGLAACKDPLPAPPEATATHGVEWGTPSPPVEREARRETIDLLQELEYCEVRHRGLSIDTGSSWGDSHRSFHAGPFGDVVHGERAGQGTAAVHGTRLEYDFWLERPTQGVRVALRVQGERARALTLFVDDKRVGEVRLVRGQSQVYEFGPVDSELLPGRHTLTLRLQRGRGEPSEPSCLLDWVRVYLPDNIEAEYAAPTRANVVQDVELGGRLTRGLVLRGDSNLRCGLFPGPQARLQVEVGYWGEGESTVQVRALTGHQEAVTLAERRVRGGEAARWSPLDLSLDAFEDGLLVLELAVLDNSGTGRAVFGAPRLTRSVPSPTELSAKNVVVIVASGLTRELIPPWAERKGQNHLYDFSRQAITFDGYRVTSVHVGEVVATLLSGLPGSRHGLVSPGLEIRERVPLLSHALGGGGGRSAFFSNVPYTFRAFGFARDFGRFDQMSPVADLPADEPLRRAKDWLERELSEAPGAQRFLVVHVRGAHPPFDLTAEEVQTLAPSEYSGILEPRRAATLLRQVRERDRSHSRKLGPKDWDRLVAMQRAALFKQDAALGALWDVLKRHDAWDDSLVVYVGDVARGDPPAVPFDPLGPLSEDRASPPLLVKLPKGEGAGRRVSLPIGTLDLSQALHGALGLPFPGLPGDADFVSLANAVRPLRSEGLLAAQAPRYVFTVDRYRLAGTLGETPFLCDIEVDPACQQDLYPLAPFHMEWLWRMALRALRTDGVTLPEDGSLATIDDDTRAALTVFGL